MRRTFPLALFWFLHFCGLGIFFPYYSLYLRENAGLTGTQVGIVLATLPLAGMLAQPFWGQVADRTGARRRVLIALTVAAACGYALLGAVHGFAALVAATAALSLFSSAIVPVSVSVTFAALRNDGPHAFGLIRVWGTLGYLICVAGFPYALHALAGTAATGPQPGLELMFAATGACVLAAALVGPMLPSDGAVRVRAAAGDWRALRHSRPVQRALLFNFAAFVFLQGPMSIFPMYVRAHGGDMDTIGRMWILMLLLEIPLVALSGAGLQRVGARGLVAIGVLAGAVRWIACGLTGDLRLIYPLQLLHGVVVAGLLLGGALYLEAMVPERLRSTAQALLSTICAAGSIVSNLGAGWLIEHLGSQAPYLAGGLGGLALVALVPWWLPARELHENG